MINKYGCQYYSMVLQIYQLLLHLAHLHIIGLLSLVCCIGPFMFILGLLSSSVLFPQFACVAFPLSSTRTAASDLLSWGVQHLLCCCICISFFSRINLFLIYFDFYTFFSIFYLLFFFWSHITLSFFFFFSLLCCSQRRGSGSGFFSLIVFCSCCLCFSFSITQDVFCIFLT